MPHAGDGFTVVSAMRHTHPQAVTLVLSGYPALDEALSAIRLQADEVLVKPIEIASLRKLIREKLANPVAPGRCPQRAWPPYWSMTLMLRFRTGWHWWSTMKS